MGYFSQLKSRLLRLSILYRIAIGNALIIIVGAVGGTLITRHLAREAADFSLMLLFAGLGVTLTVLTNYVIIKTALRPLHQLRELVDRVEAGGSDIDASLLHEPDPDIKQLANALNSMVIKLEDRNLKLRALSERAINAQEEERRRIARGLHDDTAQAMSILIIYLERLEQNIPDDRETTRERLASARKLATQTLTDLRQTIHGLRPSILDDLGLIAAVRWYARSNLESNGIRVEFDVPDDPIPLSTGLETTLFRIAQEAINNVVRHAKAESAEISLKYNNGCVCLWVSDHGRGFDVAQTSDRALELRRLGLLGIEERAELVGGDVNVDSSPGEGTRIRVCVPLSDMEAARYGNHTHSAG